MARRKNKISWTAVDGAIFGAVSVTFIGLIGLALGLINEATGLHSGGGRYRIPTIHSMQQVINYLIVLLVMAGTAGVIGYITGTKSKK